MAKRSADGSPSLAEVDYPSKKLHLDLDRHINIYDAEDDDGGSTTATGQTPRSFFHDESPSSPATTVTTPRARFPSDLKTLPCTWPGCSKIFNRPARLRDHLNSHTNSRPFGCPYEGCDKDYTVDKHLKQHIKAVHTHERNHVCPREGCGKSFVTGTRLKRHQAVHEGAERFRCTDCGQSFRKRDTLAKHVRKEHEGRKAFTCPEPGCDAEFDTKASLGRHSQRDHGEVKFWCDECGAKSLPDGSVQRVGFTTDLLLRAHIREEHQDCIFCDFKASRQCGLEQHIEMHHSGKTVQDRKTWPCTYHGCTKRFTSRSNRTCHVRTAHEGHRFICGEFLLSGPEFEDWTATGDGGCGDRFSAKARLEDHVRYIHLGHQRPKPSLAPALRQSNTFLDEISGVTMIDRATIPCPSCTEIFTRYADLDAHVEQTHSFPSSGMESTLEARHGTPLPSIFEDNVSTTWLEAPPDEEEIFAGGIDYDAPQDEWAEDEANILLLARDTPDLECHIDPNLG